MGLRRALIEADAANAAKSTFLAAISHELRTPLNAVIGFAELMKIETFGPLGDGHYREYVDDILGGGVHLLALVNEILEVTRIRSGEILIHDERVDIAAKIDRLIRSLRPDALRGGVQLNFRIEPNLPWLRADRERVWQILRHILSNAIKFTPVGGNVLVEAEQIETGMAITVKDTGIGIAAEDIPLVFERFRQIDAGHARKYEGIGLGLSLARDLVELHGGRLSLESKKGLGTTVTINFPADRLISRMASGPGSSNSSTWTTQSGEAA
jgi:signal transduction histidine kinase